MITNTLHSVSHILVAEPPTHLLHIDDYRYMSQTQRYSNAMYIPGDVQTGQIDLISVRSRCMHKHPSAHHAIHCMLRAHARYDGNTIAQRVWCVCGIENDWLETELVAINWGCVHWYYHMNMIFTYVRTDAYAGCMLHQWVLCQLAFMKVDFLRFPSFKTSEGSKTSLA